MAQARYEEWLEKDNLIKLEAWARDGLTDEQIANNMGIAIRTLYNWKNKHIQIMQALKRGKEVVDYEVENALLKKALGYDYEEEKSTQRIVDGKKVGEKIIYKKHQPPDTTAIIYWLKNRKRSIWRDKPDIYNLDEESAKIELAKAKAELEKTNAEIEKLRGTKSIDDKVVIVDDIN